MAYIVYLGYHKEAGMYSTIFSIDGTRYIYEMDAYMAEKIKAIAAKAPGYALNMAKQQGKLIDKYSLDEEIRRAKSKLKGFT